MVMTSNQAIRIALKFHDGQLDKEGVAYIWHVLRVAGMLAAMSGNTTQIDDELLAVAVLHDLLEDTDVQAPDLADLSERQTRILMLLTHEKDEPYADYIARIADDPDARLIKMADITDNLSRVQQLRSTNTRNRLTQKYNPAMKVLLQAEKQSTA